MQIQAIRLDRMDRSLDLDISPNDLAWEGDYNLSDVPIPETTLEIDPRSRSRYHNKETQTDADLEVPRRAAASRKHPLRRSIVNKRSKVQDVAQGDKGADGDTGADGEDSSDDDKNPGVDDNAKPNNGTDNSDGDNDEESEDDGEGVVHDDAHQGLTSDEEAEDAGEGIVRTHRGLPSGEDNTESSDLDSERDGEHDNDIGIETEPDDAEQAEFAKFLAGGMTFTRLSGAPSQRQLPQAVLDQLVDQSHSAPVVLSDDDAMQGVELQRGSESSSARGYMGVLDPLEPMFPVPRGACLLLFIHIIILTALLSQDQVAVVAPHPGTLSSQKSSQRKAKTARATDISHLPLELAHLAQPPVTTEDVTELFNASIDLGDNPASPTLSTLPPSTIVSPMRPPVKRNNPHILTSPSIYDFCSFQ